MSDFAQSDALGYTKIPCAERIILDRNIKCLEKSIDSENGVSTLIASGQLNVRQNRHFILFSILWNAKRGMWCILVMPTVLPRHTLWLIVPRGILVADLLAISAPEIQPFSLSGAAIWVKVFWCEIEISSLVVNDPDSFRCPCLPSLDIPI